MHMITIALAVAAISMTVTRSSLFRGLRSLVDFKLVKCPYCFAHWVSMLIWGCYALSHPLGYFDITINIFATIALSVVPMYVIECFNTLVDNNARFRGPTRVSS